MIMNYEIKLDSNNGRAEYNGNAVSLTADSDNVDTRFSMSIVFPQWEKDAYIFMPACVYDGNSCEKLKGYRPMYPAEECKPNPTRFMTEVPALNPDGSGKIEVTSGDLSVPCFGVFFRNCKKAIFIFTEQACKSKNIGFAAESGRVTIQFPVIRSKCYRTCRVDEPSTDSGISVSKGESVSSRVLIKEFDCNGIPEFYDIFFKNRRCLLSDSSADNGYTDALWNTMEAHMNNDNFSGEYYAEMTKVWQCGWVGGGMSSLPLLKHGNELSKQRAVKTLDFLTSHVASSGFFITLIINGVVKNDGGSKNEHMKNGALVRKLGDGLQFLFKHFEVIDPKESWISAAKGCADAFVRLYEKYETFGQFVNIESGEIIYGGTTSGASAISALVRAWDYFKDERYLDTARRAGEKYYQNYVAKGYTYGGPVDALCCPDSESSYAMVESMVLLYEAEKDEKWLKYAKDSLHLLSSWVMPYSYEFPKDSEFARLKVNTVGSVFANVQNKHSAPGLCTASGDAIYKLYKYTGVKEYLELLRDIAFFIPQCVSTEERPIHTWDDEPLKLSPGWICERVNTSDWEGQNRVGGVFNFSCWCETALLLSFSELYFNTEIFNELNAININ